MTLQRYRTFRHEYTRLHSVRIAHLVKEEPISWADSEAERERYFRLVSDEVWPDVRHFCMLKARIMRLSFINSTGLSRWASAPFAQEIRGAQKSRTIPAAFFLTACNEEDVDNGLREHLDKPPGGDGSHIEIISWFGYTRPPLPIKPKTHDEILLAPFRRLVDKFDNVRELALIFFQSNRFRLLENISGVFKGLDQLRLSTEPKWTPMVCGLLKGDIDAFILLGRKEMADSEELLEFLKAPVGDFWSSTIPISLYTGKLESIVAPNLELLDPLDIETTEA